MDTLKIMTYGRLGKEFEEFASSIEGVECSFVQNQDLSEQIKKYDIIAGLALPEEAEISHLKWIHAFSAGVDYWLRRKDLSKETLLTRTKGRMGVKIGEYCLAYVLLELKKISQARMNQDQNKWQQLSQENLYDQDILILGTGGIGEGIASVFRPHVNSVTGVSKGGNKKDNFDEVLKFDKLPDDLSKYAVVINALPLTDFTENLIDHSFFTRLEKAVYINIGRGGTTVIEDLLQAIEDNHVKKAVLDVFPTEPLPEDDKLWQHRDVVITAHQSGVTDFEDVKMDFLRTLEAYKSGIPNDLVVSFDKGY